MRIDVLLPRQNCITCLAPPQCNCAANEDCIVINRDCNTCSQTKCVSQSGGGGGSSNSHGGISTGATAGAIIGVLIFLALAIGAFLWYRRKMRGRKGTSVPQDIPASAETVLKRPNPTEKRISSLTEMSTVRVYSDPSNPPVDLISNSQRFPPHTPTITINPFDDTTSIQTAGTEGTNVIPIALIPSDSNSEHHADLSDPMHPIRPARSPDLDLNSDHASMSGDAVHGIAPSNRSIISYMSNASYSSDFLNEAPMIITPNKGAIRQVLGVVKAEVINAPGSLSSSSHLKPSSSKRTAVGSPLAATSFGPGDVVKEVDETHTTTDPFSDATSKTGYAPSSGSSTFIGHMSQTQEPQSNWAADTLNPPWSRSGRDSRPTSMSTQAGSIIDIGSATIVKVGSPGSATTLRGPCKTTVARLVAPSTRGSGSLGEQQAVITNAETRTLARGLDVNRRVSTSSALSATSTRADSILESFPFVPPSPISNRPMRSPSVSPLTKQAFAIDAAQSASPNRAVNVVPPSPRLQEAFKDDSKHHSILPPPPNRRILGLSTGSQLSTASSGLGSFPFQIDSGDDNLIHPQNSFNIDGRRRASLDTLALTSDLSSYPLGFDRDSVQVSQVLPHKSSRFG